jgi:hypothetical protein
MAMLEESRGPIWIVTATALAPGATNPMDLIEIVAGASSRCLIREIEIGQYSIAGDSNAEMVGLQVLRNQDTAGSGGTALSASGLTPNLCNLRQLMKPTTQTQVTPTAPSFTGAVGNTTLASNTVNAVHIVRATAFNAMGGYRYYPGFRGERWIVAFSQRLVVRLTPALAKAALFNLTMLVQEIGNGDV